MMTPHRLYVGTIGEGLFRSLDHGESFVRACEGMFVECHVRALVSHSDHPQTLFLGSEQGLYRSDDGAESWTRVDSPLNGQQLWSILLQPGRRDRLLVGTCPSRLFRSDDGGKTWDEPAVGMLRECPRLIYTRVTVVAADPADPDTLWAGVEIDALYRSHDGGRTWQPKGEGLSSRDIHALVFVPGAGKGRMLASTNNDVNLSTDGGETWQPLRMHERLPLPYYRGMGQRIGRPEEVLLGTGDRPPGQTGLIARSLDGGATWQAATMPGRANSTMWNFAVHPADPALIYAASVSGELYRSTDAGATWEKLAREFGEIRSLAWTP